MKRLSILLFVPLALPAIAAAQGVMVSPQTALTTVNGVTRPLPGATITVCAASAGGIPCAPPLVGSAFSNAGLTQPLSNPFFADAGGNYHFGIAQGDYTVSVTGTGFSGYSYQLSVFTCSPGVCVATAGSNAFSGNNTHTGQETFGGGSPWFDVTGPNFGAACDGVADDTTAVQAALTAANLMRGTVFIPPGKTCNVSTQLVLDGFAGVTVRGGWGAALLAGNRQSTLNFTGTCARAACLSLRSAGAINFYNVQLNFSGATAGPMVDLSHSKRGTDSALLGFHGVTFKGPSTSVGPIVLDQNTDGVIFDALTTFNSASVFVEGPVNNAAGFSDSTGFTDVIMSRWGTSAIENASIGWTFTRVIAEAETGPGNCVPFLTYVGNYTQMQALNVTNSLLAPSSILCSNSYTLITLPAASGNLGGFTFNNNLVLPSAGSTTGTMLSVGNGQTFSALNNVIQNVVTAFSLGTGVSADIGPNVYSRVKNQLSGTPVSGRVTIPGGATTLYGGVTPGAGITVASLPSAASNPGMMVYVTDSTGIAAEGQPCAGSSTNKALAFSNGTSWKCF
jgi:hypothetical protein